MGSLFKHLSYTRIIALSFLIVILIGSTLLCLPVASREGLWTPFVDCLFTATSATCVTGLIVYDTFTHWTVFGQLVILAMIQIGGIGLMSIITMFFIFLKKKINMHERILIVHSAGSVQMSGTVKLVRRLIHGTFFFELIGAILLAFRFVPRLGPARGLYYAFFHAISAFCNAGFDLMGRDKAFSSLTSFEKDPYVNLIIMLLIIIGGIGFLVWDDMLKHKLHFELYSLHSKLVLTTTAVLILIGTLGFFVFEYNGNLAGYSFGDRLLSSAFMSVTTRTAGFNTMDLSTLSESGSLLSMFLMLIGGSPGSTAGGIKTTTLAVVFISVLCMSRGKNDVVVFKRTLNPQSIKQACVIIMIYLCAVLFSAMLLCHIDALDLTDALFETVSAAGTVGLTRGITPGLSMASHIILIILMYTGRIGGLSMMLVFGERKPPAPIKRPTEPIIIG